MSPAYKLSYFNVTALGEPIRFLLHYGGIEFEDIRIEKHEEWPLLKPSMPFGQMPVLELNGRIAHQSMAITRYIAKQVKLNGKDDWEDLEIDAAAETINDLRHKIGAYFYETDAAVKETRGGALFTEILPYYMEKFNAQVEKNNGHLACARLTWVDMYFVGILDYLNFMAKRDIIAGYPGLEALKELVLGLPAVKAWVEKRPVTEV